jgi:hypothetical protein
MVTCYGSCRKRTHYVLYGEWTPAAFYVAMAYGCTALQLHLFNWALLSYVSEGNLAIYSLC